ncbi:UDP-N-acetylglucosamine--N-acetylmuramyl-(pentapeptide) pyrophosphoryl-undecaprenol N-acetylglucosamine transferase [Candidatus Pacebacteria bacterium]|nr:UDP-N-acetylglucosamine--N-acetylmuramyl-(pentapeptide) pyrophosphoryl-undecaprenol N-acetylglucosamine transferase [Candidatus Paceibacterota bacterium]
MRVVLVGGGTGGHFYPLIAIAEALRDRDTALNQQTELYYLGPNEYNRDSLARLNIKYKYVPAGKQRNYRSFLNFIDKFAVFFGIFVAIKRLYALYPDVVMSKGGFTSVPVVIAAWILKIPIVIHESDATPGRANRFAARFARYIGISYDDAAAHFPAEKIALTGIPIRKFFSVQQPNPHAYLRLPTDKHVLFVTGGSLGAERINNLILDSLDELLPNYTIVHQVGDTHEETVSKNAGSLIKDLSLLEHYFVFGHMTGEQIAAAEQAASLIISRAGSTSIAEIALAGKPSILIPIPEDISHDQRTNAYAYARTGAATVIEEKNLVDALLVPEVNRILGSKKVYDAMAAATKTFTRPGAAYTLADTLLGIGNEHR